MSTISMPMLTIDNELFAKQSGERAGRKNPLYQGWNWGAFLFNWLWLANMRRGWLALGIFFVTLIPIIGLLTIIWLGTQGNNIAYDGRKFQSIEQYVAVQNAWRNWGFWILGITAALYLVGAIVGAGSHAK